MENTALKELLLSALRRRHALLSDDALHRGAWRLFNGFTEGCGELAIDLMGRTAVVQDYGREGVNEDFIRDFLLEKLDFLQAILLKKRNSQAEKERNGKLIYGEKTDTFVVEHNVRYAIDLMMNHDNGFYSDTRLLRKYLLENIMCFSF